MSHAMQGHSRQTSHNRVICLNVVHRRRKREPNPNSWTAGKSDQSIQKEINPEYSLEGLLLKLKLQHFGHMMQNSDSLVKILFLGKIEGEGGSKG